MLGNKILSWRQRRSVFSTVRLRILSFLDAQGRIGGSTSGPELGDNSERDEQAAYNPRAFMPPWSAGVRIGRSELARLHGPLSNGHVCCSLFGDARSSSRPP